MELIAKKYKKRVQLHTFHFNSQQKTSSKISVDPDDSLNKTTSNSKGYFSIYGEECEVGSIEPYLRITHNCEDGILSEVIL